MRFFLAFVLLLASGLSEIALASNRSIAVVDDSGGEVRLAQPAQRVISLAPHLAEIMYAVGSGDRLVGTIRYSDYPAAVRELPVIGDAAGVSFERVLALRPDLILNWQSGLPAEIVARLSSMDYPIYQSEPAGLAGIAENLREIGVLTGNAGRGAEQADRFLARLDALRVQGRSTVSVFFQIWDAPLMTIGAGQLIGEVLSACGGRNVFSDLRIPAPQVSVEAVLQVDPDVILSSRSAQEVGHSWQRTWQKFPSMSAVRNGHLYAINADLIARPGPRLLDAVAEVCSVLDQVRASHG